jgi:hypothetical protein
MHSHAGQVLCSRHYAELAARKRRTYLLKLTLASALLAYSLLRLAAVLGWIS